MGKVKFKTLKFHFVILFIIVIVNCANKENSMPATSINRYRLIVGSIPMDPNNDADIKLGGAGWGGNAIIEINENPVKIGSSGGISFEISHWVKPGNNKLSFRGVISENLYYKILTVGSDHRSKNVLTAGIVKPNEIDNYIKEFSITSAYTPPFYMKDAIKKKESLIIEKIKKLHNMLVDHDGDSFIQAMSEGPGLWSKKLNVTDLIEMKKKDIRNAFFENLKIKVKDLNLSELKIIWGKRSVLVYEGFDHPDSNLRDPYLFEFEKPEGRKRYFSPLCLVFIDNEWIVWDY
jgi:hypothetical protein